MDNSIIFDSNSDYLYLISQVHLPLAIIDKSLIVRFTNRAYNRLFNIDEQNNTGYRIFEEGSNIEVEDLIRNTFENNQNTHGFEYNDTIENLGLRHFIIDTQLIQLGNEDYCLISANDITDIRQTEKRYTEELERSNNELKEFAYTVSHDLQEPLRMITNYLQLLEKRNSDQLNEKGLKYMAYAVDGAKRLQNLIQALLKYSRINTREREFEEVDLRLILEETIQSMEMIINETKTKITVSELPKIQADPVQIGQVFQNLISNAIKFRGEQIPEINITSEVNGKFWEICISDNGIGIEEKFYDRIFEVFRRLHTRTAYEGTGIGLAAVKKIILRHKGSIRVESEVGVGSSFYFTLPVHQEEER